MARPKRKKGKSKSSGNINPRTVGVFKHPPKSSGLEDYISPRKYDDLYFET